jgi:very-short-patch-repair endonuclease
MKTDMHFGASPVIFEYANQLRKNLTRAEQILWGYLRKNYLGYKFRRQHPMDKYVVDFYCHPLRLVIEIDGEIHTDEKTKEDDIVKERDLKNFGLTILHFTNEQVYCDIDNVISEIYFKIDELKLIPLSTPKSTPSLSQRSKSKSIRNAIPTSFRRNVK